VVGSAQLADLKPTVTMIWFGFSSDPQTLRRDDPGSEEFAVWYRHLPSPKPSPASEFCLLLHRFATPLANLMHGLVLGSAARNPP
jgi:hypothetical protein